MDREEIAQSCLVQAEWTEKLGSPMYTALLHRITEDVRAGGPCLAAMEPHVVRARGLAPLLLLSAVHRMVLDGKVPEAAKFYPSAGGTVDVETLWPHFLDAVPQAVLPVCVQTNEVRRSRGLLPGFVEVAKKTGLPLRLLEIGSSAGLNLRWDHFPFLDVPDFVRVAERRGCDLNPIDPTLDESKPAMLCFVWPDQKERLQQLIETLEIARRVPARVDQSDAIPWLEKHLAKPRAGVATVVFHSVVMPYLSEEARADVRRIIEEAGARASAEAPLAWLSMEPAAEGPDIHLTMWPGGERRLIAQASFHGEDVKVL
jgi:hypothetical protein